MGVGPPWSETPAGWMLNGHPLHLRIPDTVTLARVVAIPDNRGAGLWVTFACTAVPDHQVLLSALVDHHRPLTLGDCDRIADMLVERITGWKRWEASRLWAQTIGAWPIIDGELLGRGVDLAALPPDRATNVAFGWWRAMLGKAKSGEWERWLRDLEREPRRVIIAEAEQPMDPAQLAELQGLIGAATGPAAAGETVEQLP